MPFNILHAEPKNTNEEARKIFCQLGILEEKELTRFELIELIPSYHALIIRIAHRIDKEVLEAAAQLKVIVTMTTGLDHIDLEEAKRRGITVLSLRGETEFLNTVCATAEHTWALLLNLIRRIPHAMQNALEGKWNRDRYQGRELQGYTLGIVGLGRLGKMVAHYAQAFGMPVIAYDPYQKSFPTWIKRCFSLGALVKEADIVSLHVHLNKETEQMIDKAIFDQMKRGAILINTARGSVVDEIALLEALENGCLRGAALDVICGETVGSWSNKNPLLKYANKHENLIITPHIAGATLESTMKTENFMANKLKVFVEQNIKCGVL